MRNLIQWLFGQPDENDPSKRSNVAGSDDPDERWADEVIARANARAARQAAIRDNRILKKPSADDVTIENIDALNRDAAVRMGLVTNEELAIKDGLLPPDPDGIITEDGLHAILVDHGDGSYSYYRDGVEYDGLGKRIG